MKPPLRGPQRADGLRLSWVGIAWGLVLACTIGCDCHGRGPRFAPCAVQAGAAVDFGEQNVGSSKLLPNQVLITNNGGLPLGLAGSSLVGPNAGDFSLASSLPVTLQPGASVAATLRFTPSAAGQRQATLEVNTDCTGTPTVKVPLSGTGLQIQLCATPSPVDFGNVQVGGSPATQTVTLTNCGGSPADVQFASPAIEGPNASDFSASGQSNLTLQPNATMTLTVVYAPAAVGASTADIPYQVCSSCSPQKLNLTGVGVDGKLVFAPNPVSFGTVQDGTIVSTAVTGSNTGTEDITVSSIAVGTSTFRINTAPPTPFVVPAGTTFDVSVAFAPYPGSTNTDTLTATWTVADPTVAARPATDPLVGDQQQLPCTLSVAPAGLYFGSVNANVPVTKVLTLTDKGSVPCSVSGIAIVAGSDPGFVLANPGLTSLTVPAGLSATFSVTYSTSAITSPYLRKGTLTFQTGDASNPTATVPLNAYLNNTVYSAGWPKWHFDNRNSGQSEANTAWLAGKVGWKYNVGSPNGSTYINSPVVDTSGNIYQLGMSGTLYALKSNGSLLWQTPLSDPSGDPHPSTPAILSDGSMYVISGSDASCGGNPCSPEPNALFYVSSSGTVLYSQQFGEDGFDACPGLGNDGTLYEADDDGPASAFGSGDPYSAIAFKANGSSVTQLAGLSLPLTAESERFGIAIADDGTSYWGNNGQFFALAPPSAGFGLVPAWPKNGVTLASPGGPGNPSNLATEVISDLAVDGRVNNFIFAYSAWETITLAFPPVVTVQGVLAALRPADGSIAWTLQLPQAKVGGNGAGAGNAAPAVADDGTVYVGNGDGLRAVDGAAGKQLWLFTCANVTSAPAIGGDGSIFFGTEDGNLYAVHPDGTLRFKVTTGGPVSASPAIGNDGTVYFTSDDGYLYAIK